MLLVAAWIASLLGCEQPSALPELAQVTGVITLDGEPLEGAEVKFYPDFAKRSQGSTDENGRYELFYDRDVRGAVLGRHTVVISKMVMDYQTAPRELLPEEYSGDSKIRHEVKAGTNVFDFELESAPASDAEESGRGR